jgi:hypothetical protein
MKNELKTAVLTALDRASREMSLKILENEQTREGIARILLEEIEKKGITKELTVMDALRMMMEEIKRTRETAESIDKRTQILEKDHEHLADGIKAVIRGQTRVMETVSNVVRQEGQYTREKINEAKNEINEKMSDHFYYANRLHP